MIILRKPIISEKSMKLAKTGLYTFLVDKNTTKPNIAKIVADKFKVDVLSVRIVNIKGEVKMQRRVRKSYQTSGKKKALVQVKKGQTIPVFETPAEDAVVTTAESEPQVIKEKRNLLSRSKVKIERSAVGAAPSTQRKVIPT